MLLLLLHLTAYNQTTFYDSITNKYGIIDRFGKLILKPTYDKMYSININGLAIFESKGKYGLINDKGIILLKPLFEYYQLVLADDIQNDLLPLQYADSPGNVKIGYYNTNGLLKIPYKFSFASTFCNGIACVSLDGEKYNFINTLGENLSPKLFDDWIRLDGVYYGIERIEDENFNENNIFFKIIRKNEIILEDRKFTKFKDKYYGMFSGLSENCHEKPESSSNLKSYYVNDKFLFGYINKDSVTIIPPKYKMATEFNENRALVFLNDSALIINEKDEIIINLSKKIPNLTYKNYEISPDVYNEQIYNRIGFKNGLIQLTTILLETTWDGEEKQVTQNGNSYFIDLNGNIIKKGGFKEIIHNGFGID
jgi:hypothetical protein